MEHTIKEGNKFKVVGIGVDCNCISPDTPKKAKKAWDDFCKRLNEVDRDGKEWVGTSSVIGECDFRYVAGVKTSTDKTPEGMEIVEVTDGKYAVFPYTGPMHKLGQFYADMMPYMEKENLKESKRGPWYELYPQGWEDGKPFEIWIPID